MKMICTGALIFLSLFSCKKEKSNLITLAGNIENADTDSIFLIRDTIRKAIPLQNGKFHDTLRLADFGYFELSVGQESTEIFINPGDSLFVSTDMQSFDENLKYGGSSEKENNYLARKQLKIKKIDADRQSFFSALPADFKTKLNAFRNEILQELEKENLDSKFMELEKKNIEYFYHTVLAQYPASFKYFTRNIAILPHGFEEGAEKINLENEADFVSIPAYKQYIFYQIANQMGEATSAEEIEKIISDIQSPIIKDAMMKAFLLYPIESGTADAARYNTFIQKNSTDEKLKKQSADIMLRFQKLLPGKPSPKFTYPDTNGKTVSLDDLKGNLVYIDVWATWCGPCYMEIPYLKQLVADYEGKNLKIVSISIDSKKDFEKWQNTVRENDLKGFQVFADKDWDSEFVRDYGIKEIPRFILIDQKGNILNADAPRPSDPQIRMLMDLNL
ncbi:MAG: TlpA disulfide reductase family protein [Moheibacter sp.]